MGSAGVLLSPERSSEPLRFSATLYQELFVALELHNVSGLVLLPLPIWNALDLPSPVFIHSEMGMRKCACIFPCCDLMPEVLIMHIVFPLVLYPYLIMLGELIYWILQAHRRKHMRSLISLIYLY